MIELRHGDITLRPIAPEDAGEFALLCNDIDIARNTARIPHPYGRADAEAFVAKCGGASFGADGDYVFAVRRDGRIVACAGANRTSDGIFEIGYWVGAPFRRQGLATRAARAVTHFAFECLNAKTATAGFFADNPASGRILDRIGFRRTGETVYMQSIGRGEAVETLRLSLDRRDYEVSAEIVIAQTDA